MKNSLTLAGIFLLSSFVYMYSVDITEHVTLLLD